MSTAASSNVTFDRLDALMGPDQVWRWGAAEGRALGQHILESPSPIVVLYGPARSGRTQLIRRSVVPVIEQRWSVSYAECGHETTALAAASAPAIQILDDAERCLVDEGPRAALVRQLRMAGTDGGPAKCVLVLQEDYLNRLFRLGGAVPGILDDLCELPAMSGAKFFDALSGAAAEFGITLSPGLRAAVARDLDAVRAEAPGPELVAILVFELHRARGASQTVSEEDYASLGGMTGLLEEHLEYLVTNLPNGIDPAIGWAVILEAMRTPADEATDLENVANRFDVGVEVPAEVLRFLESERHVLRRTPEGGHRLVPSALKSAAAARSSRIDETTERSRSLLRNFARHFVESGALAPRYVFSRVHDQRRALVVTEDEARLMLSCALDYADEDDSSTLAHWLRRVREPYARAEILLEAVCDPRPEVRRRSATCLRECPADEVRSQLHLVALRDPDATVRDAAVGSLGHMATDDLRESLLRETEDPNSPYRVQAIDTLRIFSDPHTIDRLFEFAKARGPAHGVDARAHAIKVLGTYETSQSVTALVDIALRVEDAADRTEAARALGQVAAPEAARLVLDTVERETGFRWLSRWAPWSARESVWRLCVTAAAMVTMLSNVALHGLILVLIGRVRLGVILAAASLLFAVLSWWAWWWVTMLAGFLVPTGMLLRERMNGSGQSLFKRTLGITLFAGGCATAFAAVHGLASLAIGRIRYGLSLIGFEAVAVCLMLSSVVFFQDAARLSDIFTVTSWANWILFATGVVLAVGTYLVGVGSVAVAAFGRAFGWDDRRPLDLLFEELLGHPVVSSLVVNDFCAGDSPASRSATRLLRRHAGRIRSQLSAAWDAAELPLKRRIFAVMARRPDAASVAFMERVSPTLGRGWRLRYGCALWKFRLSLWPKPVLFLMPLTALALLSYGAALWEFAQKNPSQLLEQVVSGTEADARKAIETLGVLATSGERRLSASAVTSLQIALTDAEVAKNPARADQILERLPIEPQLGRLEEALATLLTTSPAAFSTRERAITFLRKRETPEAVNTLRRFVAGPGFDGSTPANEERVLHLKRQAVAALGEIKGAGTTPLRALEELRFSPVVSAELKEAARLAAEGASVLIAEERLEAGDHASAIETAGIAAKSAKDAADRQRVANVFGRAYTLSGLAAFGKKDYVRASADLTAALRSGADKGSLLEALGLAQQLGFVLHESMVFSDPRAFESSYQAFKEAEPLSQQVPEVTLQFASDLAEAALTSGRHDEAFNRAQAAIAQARRFSRRDTELSMHVVAYAALVMKGDAAGAQERLSELNEAYKALPSGFTNTWTWTGTRRYIDMSSLGLADKSRLYNAIDLAAKRKP